MKRRTLSILLVCLFFFTPLASGFTYMESIEEIDYHEHKALLEEGSAVEKEFLEDSEKHLIESQRLNAVKGALTDENRDGLLSNEADQSKAKIMDEAFSEATQSSDDKTLKNLDRMNEDLNGSVNQDIEIQEYETIFEEEPNNDFHQANPIKPMSNVVGTITYSRYDVDRFMFTVSVPGTFEIMGIWLDEYYGYGWEDDLYFGISNANDRENYIAVAEYYTFSDGSAMRYLEVDLEKGDYYITLLADDYYEDLYVGEAYVLFTDFFPDEVDGEPEDPVDDELPIFYEKEPNDSIATANHIVPDVMVAGSITDVSYDIDYFKIELKQAGTISIGGIWIGDYFGYGWEDDLLIGIVDENDKVIYAGEYYLFDDGSAIRFLEDEIDAGIYYIIVLARQDYGSLYVGEPYLFSVIFESDEEELPTDGYRIAGDNRYQTAHQIAKENDENPETVIIVRGDSVNGIPQVVDGLTASGLAGAENAQILMVSPNRIPNATWSAIHDLNPQKAIIVGGEAAVGDTVRKDLEDYGLEVSRVSGDNRFSTAAEVALQIGNAKDNTAIVVNGFAEVDSLVGGPLAHQGYPILMVNNARNMIPLETIDAIQTLEIEKLIIIGGTGVVSEAIESQLENLEGVTVETRYGGNNRVETSLLVGSHKGFSEADRVSIVNGWSFVDAVAASTLGVPVIYYNERHGIIKETEEFLTTKTDFRAIGGSSTIPDSIVRDLILLMGLEPR